MQSYFGQVLALNFASKISPPNTFSMQKKPWYHSKIVLAALTLSGIFGYNLLTGWLTNQGVTPEQLQALQLAYPDIADAIQKARDGGSWLSSLGLAGSLLIAALRKWFTSKLLV